MAYLSQTTGVPIAIIEGGEHDGDIIHRFDPDVHKNDGEESGAFQGDCC